MTARDGNCNEVTPASSRKLLIDTQAASASEDAIKSQILSTLVVFPVDSCRRDLSKHLDKMLTQSLLYYAEGEVV